jgi:CelD/BcsL family acetyltransferase involved in cellulose biosynthesis
MKVTEVTNVTDFLDLRDKWNTLLHHCDNTIFSTWEWLSTWWKHFGNNRNLRMIMAQDGDDILGIAPLMISQYSLFHVGKIRRIEFIGNCDSDVNDFIIKRKKENCLKVLLNRLNEISDWEMLELCEISEESSVVKALGATDYRKLPKFELKISNLSPYINLPNSIDIFEAGLGSNMKKNLKRYMRKLTQKYDVKFKTHKDFNSIKEAMNTFFKLHQRRWESKGELGLFADKTSRDFNIDLAEIFNTRNWLSLYFLTVNDKPVAAAYTFAYKMKLHARLTGFDPDFGNFRVGSLLKMHIIEDCITKGFKEYNLSRGAGFGKEYWSTGVRKNYNIKMFNTNLRGQFFSYARKLLNNT